MVPSEILEVIRQRPFEPFRLHLSDGSSYEVRNPELCMVGTSTVIIGLTKAAGEDLFERTVKLDVFHITRVEQLPAVGAKGNGYE